MALCFACYGTPLRDSRLLCIALAQRSARGCIKQKSETMQKTIKDFDRNNEYIGVVEELFATNTIDEEEADFLRRFVTAS